MIFTIMAKPYSSTLSNALSLFNESITFITFGGLLLINSFDINEEIEAAVGWCIVVFVSLSLLATWSVLFPGALKAVYIQIREWWARRSRQAQSTSEPAPQANPSSTDQPGEQFPAPSPTPSATQPQEPDQSKEQRKTARRKRCATHRRRPRTDSVGKSPSKTAMLAP
jgi:hypothetical protein